jgi:hypothetical protein
MASFWSGVNVRLVGGAAGSMSSVTFPFWARAVTDAALVKVMVLGLPVSPWSDEWPRQVSHVSLTDRGINPEALPAVDCSDRVRSDVALVWKPIAHR